jgi:hypothetical protein
VQEETNVIHPAEQPYAAIEPWVALEEIGPTAQKLMPELFRWLRARGIEPAGVALGGSILLPRKEKECSTHPNGNSASFYTSWLNEPSSRRGLPPLSRCAFDAGSQEANVR